MRFPPSSKLPPKDVTIKKIRMQRFTDTFLGNPFFSLYYVIDLLIIIDQFKTAVLSFAPLPQHPNILPLVGGCIEVTICTVHEYL